MHRCAVWSCRAKGSAQGAALDELVDLAQLVDLLGHLVGDHLVTALRGELGVGRLPRRVPRLDGVRPVVPVDRHVAARVQVAPGVLVFPERVHHGRGDRAGKREPLGVEVTHWFSHFLS